MKNILIISAIIVTLISSSFFATTAEAGNKGRRNTAIIVSAFVAALIGTSARGSYRQNVPCNVAYDQYGRPFCIEPQQVVVHRAPIQREVYVNNGYSTYQNNYQDDSSVGSYYSDAYQRESQKLQERKDRAIRDYQECKGRVKAQRSIGYRNVEDCSGYGNRVREFSRRW